MARKRTRKQSIVGKVAIELATLVSIVGAIHPDSRQMVWQFVNQLASRQIAVTSANPGNVTSANPTIPNDWSNSISPRVAGVPSTMSYSPSTYSPNNISPTTNFHARDNAAIFAQPNLTLVQPPRLPLTNLPSRFQSLPITSNY